MNWNELLTIVSTSVSTLDWLDKLNLIAVLITIFAALSVFFRKSLDKYKQSIATLNKTLRFRRIKKLRRQYFWMSQIEDNQTLLISFIGRQILAGLIIALSMLLIGFLFTYQDNTLLQLFGTVSLLFMYLLFMKHLDEILDVLLALKTPQTFKEEKLLELKQLRTKR